MLKQCYVPCFDHIADMNWLMINEQKNENAENRKKLATN